MSSCEEQPSKNVEGDLAALRWRVSELESLLTRKEQLIANLARKEEVLHATLDSTADGILAVDECGHLITSNRQFAKMWRIPPDLIEAGDDNELLNFVLDQLENPEQFLYKVREIYRSYNASNDTLHFRDGRVFIRSSLPLVMGDTLCGRVWTFRDVTPSAMVASGKEGSN